MVEIIKIKNVRKIISYLSVYICLINYVNAADSIYYELWDIRSLENIGGHSLQVIGNPEVVATDIGDAVKFDGDGDMLLIENNPLGDTKEFTVEVVFKPDAGINITNEPRFIHIGEANGYRVMMEIRVNSNNEWYLDGFMKTDNDDLTLIDATKTHPTNDWMHAAITYSNNIFTTYVNGEKELTDKVVFLNTIVNSIGQTSIGARMNQKNWYSGLVKYLKISHAALDPKEFIFIHNNDTTPVDTSKKNSIKKVISFNNVFNVYPNPANQYLNIFINKPIELNSVNIYNVLGKEVLNTSCFPATINTIDISHLKEGFYFVQAKADYKQITKKIYIKH